MGCIVILPAKTRYRLVGKVNPYLVENVGQAEGTGQPHFSNVMCARECRGQGEAIKA